MEYSKAAKDKVRGINSALLQDSDQTIHDAKVSKSNDMSFHSLQLDLCAASNLHITFR